MMFLKIMLQKQRIQQKNSIEQIDAENIQVNNDSILEKENEKESNKK